MGFGRVQGWWCRRSGRADPQGSSLRCRRSVALHSRSIAGQPKCSLLPLQRSSCCLQATRICQKTRIQPESPERRARCVHTLTTTGSMAREASTFYKRLANLLSHKQEKPYSMVMGWLRCRLSFAILRSAIMCIRGTRSSFGRPVNEEDLTLASTEGQVPHENQ